MFLTEAEWIEKFKPIMQVIEGEITEYPKFFETYGEDLEFLNKQNPLCIWTDMDGDNCNFIVSGAKLANRNGYYVTEIPFEETDRGYIEIYLSHEDYDDIEDFYKFL